MQNVHPALVIMSRIPSQDGKSRLGSVLSPAQREALQWALLEDTLDKIAKLSGVKCFLAVTPYSEVSKLSQVTGFEAQLMPQPGGNLGQRMRGIAEQLFLNGHAPVIMIGTDVPSLPPSYIAKAISLLDDYNLVLGPAFDGGYYLIGMQHFDRRVFEGINWGSETVLEQTIKICVNNKLSYSLLDILMDIDRPGDLQALLAQFENNKTGFTPAPLKTIQLLKSFERIKLNE